MHKDVNTSIDDPTEEDLSSSVDMNAYFSDKDESVHTDKNAWRCLKDVISKNVAKVDIESVKAMGVFSNIGDIAKGAWGAAKNSKNTKLSDMSEKLQSVAKDTAQQITNKVDMQKVKSMTEGLQGLAQQATAKLPVQSLKSAADKMQSNLTDMTKGLLGKKSDTQGNDGGSEVK